MKHHIKSAQALARAEDHTVHWLKFGLRAALSVLVSLGFIWLLLQRLNHIDLAELLAGFERLSPESWLGALALTVVSFTAIGHYDAALHQHLGSAVAPAVARRAGICAIAVSQTLGLGLLTGSILRWRLLPGTSLWQATRLTALVALSFLAGWGFVTALTLCLLPDAPFRLPASLALGLLCLTGAVALAPPVWAKALPNGFTLAKLGVLTAIDTFAAAAALWMLCPPEMALPFATLLPAFLLAFGAGLISGAPGGVGPFEMALLALLPSQPEAALLTAVLAWRACYYALPALLGAAAALHGSKPCTEAPAATAWQLLRLAKRAESGLALQGEHQLIAAPPQAALLVARTRHFVVGLFDPIAARAPAELAASLRHLQKTARAANCSMAFYKASARTAVTARAAGQACLRIAQEAVIEPARYQLDSPRRAGLRRKLRRASQAGLHISQPSVQRDWAKLRALAEDWAKLHGGERGFSMGRFCPHYLNYQRLYIAWQNAAPIAFVSFHIGKNEWTLDLMRHGAALPDGCMHLLIQTAIEDAARLGVARLSLAAVPECRLKNRLLNRLLGRMTAQTQGLVRFKSSFAPRWQPLYLTAPNPAALLAAAAEIAQAIHHPAPLRPPNPRAIEHDHAEFEFASDATAWQRQKE